jgi:hypothetical protein
LKATTKYTKHTKVLSPRRTGIYTSNDCIGIEWMALVAVLKGYFHRSFEVEDPMGGQEPNREFPFYWNVAIMHAGACHPQGIVLRRFSFHPQGISRKMVVWQQQTR